MTRFHSFLDYIANAKFSNKEVLQSLLATVFVKPESFFSDEGPTYAEKATEISDAITKVAGEVDPTITVTNRFHQNDIPVNSIAYHRIFGPIIADDEYSRWYFSTKQFLRDLKAAENNPNIIAHFAHVNSGGGEAWMLEKAFEAVKNLKKPYVAFIEKKCCSAALFINCPAKRIFSYTINDTHGSLGTMVAFMNIQPYYEKEGVQFIEEYAHKSDLKNKKFNDLLDGKAEQYITEELDPLQQQFETAVRSVRPKLKSLPEDDPVFRGETFDGQASVEIGLADEIAELETAVVYTYNLGMQNANKKQAHAKALSYIN